VKVSPTEWYERPVKLDPAGCLGDAANFRYTERQSDDETYLLLYDEGRSLFSHIKIGSVGQSGPSAWRKVASDGWNDYRTLKRMK
jgi:hypothetical protein